MVAKHFGSIVTGGLQSAVTSFGKQMEGVVLKSGVAATANDINKAYKAKLDGARREYQLAEKQLALLQQNKPVKYGDDIKKRSALLGKELKSLRQQEQELFKAGKGHSQQAIGIREAIATKEQERQMYRTRAFQRQYWEARKQQAIEAGKTLGVEQKAMLLEDRLTAQRQKADLARVRAEQETIRQENYLATRRKLAYKRDVTAPYMTSRRQGPAYTMDMMEQQADGSYVYTGKTSSERNIERQIAQQAAAEKARIARLNAWSEEIRKTRETAFQARRAYDQKQKMLAYNKRIEDERIKAEAERVQKEQKLAREQKALGTAYRLKYRVKAPWATRSLYDQQEDGSWVYAGTESERKAAQALAAEKTRLASLAKQQEEIAKLRQAAGVGANVSANTRANERAMAVSVTRANMQNRIMNISRNRPFIGETPLQAAVATAQKAFYRAQLKLYESGASDTLRAIKNRASDRFNAGINRRINRGLTEDEAILYDNGRGSMSRRTAATLALNRASQNAMGKIYGGQMIYNTGKQIISAMIAQTKELDDQIRVYNKLLPEWDKGDQMTYLNELAKVGTQLGKTKSEMTEASMLLTRSGYGGTTESLQKQNKELTTQAVLLSNIADEEMSVGDAADSIVAVSKAWQVNDEDVGKFAAHYVNAVNEISNNMAVNKEVAA